MIKATSPNKVKTIQSGDWRIDLGSSVRIYHRHYYPHSDTDQCWCSCPNWECGKCGEKPEGYMKWLISTRKLRNVQ